MISFLLAVALAQSQANNFDDNIEAYANGSNPTSSAPDLWDPVTSPTATVTNTPPAAAVDGTKVIRIDRTGANEGIRTTGNLAISTGVYSVELMMLKSNTTTETRFNLRRNDNTVLCRMRFNAAGKLQYDGAGGWVDVLNYSANTWYRIRFEVNTAGDDAFSFWVDNVQYASGADTQANGDFGHLYVELLTDNTNSTYVDDAEVYTAKKWIGNGSTSWNSAGNWSPSGVPGAADTARITDQSKQSFRPVLDVASTTIAKLEFDDTNLGPDNAVLDLNGNTLTVTGDVELESGATLTAAGGTLNATGAANTFDLDGTLTISTGTVDADGTFDGTGSTITFTASGTLELGGPVTSLGTDAAFTEGTGTVVYDRTGAQTVQDVTYHNLTIRGTAATLAAGTIDVLNNVWIDGATASLTALAGQTINVGGDWTLTGNFVESTSTVVFNSATKSQAITVTGAGDRDFRSVNITNTGGQVSVAAGSLFQLAAGGTLTITGGAVLDVNGTHDLSSGAAVVFTGSGRLQLGGAITSNMVGGSLAFSTGTVEYDNTAAAQTVDGNVDYYNLEIDDSGQTATANAFFTVNNNLLVTSGTFSTGANTINVTALTDVNGTLSIGAGGIIDANGTYDATAGSTTFTGAGTLRLGGTVSGLGTLTASTGTVVYDGAADQTVDAKSYYNLQIDKANPPTDVATASGGFSASNALTVTDGKFRPNGFTVSVTGAVTNGDRIELGAGASTVTAGSLTNNGTIDGGNGTGLFTVNGGTTNNATIDLSLGGTFEVKGTYTDAGSVTAGAGTLKFNSGINSGTLASETALDIELATTGTAVEFTSSTFDALVLAPDTWLTSGTHGGTPNAFRYYVGSRMVWTDPAADPGSDADVTIVQGTVELTSSVTVDTVAVNAGATFKMLGGGVLNLDETLTVAGTWSSSGTPKPQVTEVGAGTGYEILVSGTIALNGLVVDNPDGANNPDVYAVRVAAGATIQAIDKVDFQNGAGASTRYLRVEVSTATPFEFSQCSFDANCLFNVSLNNTAPTITMSGATGAKGADPAGEANDDDPGAEPPHNIAWIYPRVWTGAVDTDWNTAGNWSPAAVPTSADDVIIGNQANDPTLAAVGSEAYCKSLLITDGILTLSTKILNVYGGLTIQTGTLTPVTGTLAMRGAVNQSVDPNGQSFYHFQINKTGGTVTAASLFDINGNFTLVGGTFDPASFTHAVAGAWTESGGTTFQPTVGTIRFDGTSGTVTAAGGNRFNHVTVAGGRTVTAGSNLDINGNLTLEATAVVTPGSYAHTVAGNLDLRVGTYNAAAGTLTLDGVSPTIDVSASATDLFNFTINVAGTASMAGGSEGLDVGGAFTLAGGTFSPGALTHNVAGNWDDFGGTFQPASGTIVLDGGTSTIKMKAGNRFNNLQLGVNDGATKSVDAASAGLDVNGAFTLTGPGPAFSGTFDPGSPTHTVAGNWNDTGGVFQATAGKIKLDGGGAQTLNPRSTNNFFNLEIANAVDVSLVSNFALDVNGELKLSSGTFNASAAMTTLELGGNWTMAGGTYTTGAATVVLDGTGTQSLDTVTVQTLNINKPSGTAQLSGDLTVNANVTMGGGSSGTLNLGTRILSISGNLTVNSGNGVVMSGDCTLRLGSGSVVDVYGTFASSGATPTITRISGGNYAWTFRSGCSIDVSRLRFQYPNANGMTIENGNNIVRLKSVDWQNIVAGGKYLRITGFSGAFTQAFSGHIFDTAFLPGGKNVSANSGGAAVQITMTAASGNGGVEAYEEQLGAPAADIIWPPIKTWVGRWARRKTLTVAAQDAVPAGYTVFMTVNTSNPADFQSDCDDLRIVYFNGSSYVQLARDIVNPGTATTSVRFKLEAGIGQNGTDANYYMYYANPNATSPSQDLNDVYDYYDAFNSLANWSEYGTTESSASGGVASIHGVEGDLLYLTDPGGKGLRNNSQGFIIRARSKATDATKRHHALGWYLQENPADRDRYGFRARNGGGNDYELVEWTNNTADTVFAGTATPSPGNNVWYEYEIRVATDNTFTILRDDANSLSGNDTTRTSGRLWLGYEGGGNDWGNWDWLTIRIWVTNEPNVSAGGVTTISSLWSDPMNWNPIGKPTSADDVIIDGNYTYAPSIDENAGAGSLAVGDTAASVLSFASGAPVLTLTVGGNVRTGSLGTIDGATPLSNDTISLTGDWDRQAGGVWNPGNTTVIFAGSPELVPAETWYNLTIDGIVTTSGSQTIQNDLLINNGDQFNFNGGAHSVGNSATLRPGSQMKLGPSAMTLDVTGNYLIESTATLDVEAGSFIHNGTLTNQGTVKMGTGLLDANGTFNASGGVVDFNGAGATLRLGGPITSLGTFNEGTGTVVVDGTAAQTLPSDTFYRLTISNTDVAGVTAGGAITVSNTLTISAASLLSMSTFALTGETVSNNGTLDVGSGTATINGSYAESGGEINGSGTLAFASSSTGTILNDTMATLAAVTVSSMSRVECSNCTMPATITPDVTSWLVSHTHNQTANDYRFFGTLNWNDPATYDTASAHNVRVVTGTVTQDAAETVASLTLDATLVNAAYTLDATGAVTVNSGGTLDLRETAIQKVGTSMTINSGGTLLTSGSSKPTIVKSGGSAFSFTANSGAVVNLVGLSFDGPDANGMNIKDGATIVDIDRVDFKNGNPATTKYLKIEITAALTFDFANCSFDASCLNNVSVPAGGSIDITMTDAGGVKGQFPAGEANDDDPDEPADDVTWDYSVEWIGGDAGGPTDWNNANNWNPPFVPTTTTSATIDDKASDPVLDIATGLVKRLNVGTGILDLNGNTLEVYGDMIVGASADLIHSNGKVAFRGGLAQSITCTDTLYDVDVDKTGGTLTAATNLTLARHFTLVAGAFAPSTLSHTIAGNWNDSGGTFTPTAGTVTFNGGITTIQTGAANNFFHLTVSAGTKSMAGANELDVNGNFTLSGGATFVPGSFGHSVAGNWDDSGGVFSTLAGTITLDGASPTIKVGGTNSFYHLTPAVSGTVSMAAGSAGIDIDGNFTLASGTFAPNSLTHEVEGNWDDTGGTFAPTAGTIEFNGGVGTIKTNAANNFFHLRINSTATKSMAAGSTGIDADGDFTIAAGTFAPGSLTDHTVGGNWDDSGGTFAPTAGTITLDGAAASTIRRGGTNRFFNLTMTGGGTKSMHAASTGLDIDGALTLLTSTRWDPGSLTHTVAGAWDDFSGLFTPAAGTIRLDGGTSTIKAHASNNFWRLEISSSGTRSMAASSAGIDVNENFSLLSGTFAPDSLTDHSCAGNWDDSAGTFQPTAGRVTLDGAASTVKVGASNSFFDLTVNSSGTKSMAGGSAALDVNGNFDLSVGTFNPGAFTHEVAGNYSAAGTLTTGVGCTFRFDGAADQTIGAETFDSIAVANTGGAATIEVSLTGDVTVLGTTTVSQGILQVASPRILTQQGSMTVAAGSTLDLVGAATVRLASGVAVTVNGAFKATGSTPTLTTTGVPGVNFYSLTFGVGSTIDIQALNLDSANTTVAGDAAVPRAGMVILSDPAGAPDTTITNVNNIAFTNLLSGAPNYNAAVWIGTPPGARSITFSNASFDASCGVNVRSAPTSVDVINMSQALGARAGEAYDLDQSEATPGTVTPGNIDWLRTLNWDGGAATTDWENGTNWSPNIAGAPVSGDICIVPSTFGGANKPVVDAGGTFPCYELRIQNGQSVTVNAATTLDIGTKLQITSLGTFTLTSGTLRVGGNLENGSGGTFSQAVGTSVEFDGTTAQTITPGAATVLQNITISNVGGTVTPGADLDINGLLTVNANAIVDLSGRTVSIAGGLTSAATSTYTVDGVSLVQFDAAAGQTVTGTASLGADITVVSSSVTLAAGAVLDGRNVTISGGTTLTISGATLRVGGTLTITGSLDQGVSPSGARIVYDGTANQTIANITYNGLGFDKATSTGFLPAMITVTDGNLTIDVTTGLLDLNGFTLVASGGMTVSTGATLILDEAASQLQTPNGEVVTIDGTLTAANSPTMTVNGAFGAGWGLILNGPINVNGLNVRYVDAGGVRINGTATVTQFKAVDFRRPAAAPADRFHLNVTHAGPLYVEATDCFFDLSFNTPPSATTGNVRVSDSDAGGNVVVTLEDRDDATNGAGRGETRDLDDNTGRADWIMAITDLSGVPGPSPAFDLTTFAGIGTYVTVRNANGTADRIYILGLNGELDGGFLTPYYEVPEAPYGDVVGEVWWDTEGVENVFYFGTTNGYVFRIINTGAALTLTPGWPYSNAGLSSVTSPVISDGTNIYFGGTGGGSPRVFAVEIAAIASFWETGPLGGSVQSAPSMTFGTPNQLIIGGGAGVYRINATTGFVDNTNTDVTSVVAPVNIVIDRTVAASMSGAVNRMVTNTLTTDASWPYVPGGAHSDPAVRGMPWREISNLRIYYGDGDGHVFVIKGAAVNHAPFPLQYGTSTFGGAVQYWAGYIYIANWNGQVFVIQESDGAVVRQYDFGAGVQLGTIWWDALNSRYVVGGGNGRVYFFPEYP